MGLYLNGLANEIFSLILVHADCVYQFYYAINMERVCARE